MGRLNWVRLFAGLATGLAGIADAQADPPPARITIGDLTFTYELASWEIVREGGRLIGTCVQDDCKGAVLDITRREGEDGCSKDAMSAEAERRFPVPGRAYANVVRAGRFALVLAERHDGPDLSSPAFIQACVAWQGAEYRFAMRPETVGRQSWIGGALHYLVSRATAPAARMERVRIGEVSFDVSTEAWAVSRVMPDETVWLECRMPTCHEPGLTAALSAHTPARPCPAPFDQAGLIDGTETEISSLHMGKPDGIDFTISKTFLGCRNYVPPRFAACTVHDGRSYHLSTFGGLGCRASVWDIPEGALIDLLKSATIAN